MLNRRSFLNHAPRLASASNGSRIYNAPHDSELDELDDDDEDDEDDELDDEDDEDDDG